MIMLQAIGSVIFLTNSYSSDFTTCSSHEVSNIQTGFEDLLTLTPSFDVNHTLLEGTINTNQCIDSIQNVSHLGKLHIQYHNGLQSDRLARIIEDPKDTSNRVLQFWLKKPSTYKKNKQLQKGRVQMNLYDNVDVKHTVISVRMYLHPDISIIQSFPKSINWLTISEWWNNAGWTHENYPFRISLNLVKEQKKSSAPLVFKVHAQTFNAKKRHWDKKVWESINRSFVVPVDRWLTLLFEVVEGDANNGRFIFSVANQNGKRTTIFDIYNYTHHPSDPMPDGFSHINPIKLYTSGELIDYVREKGGTVQVFWDDLQISVYSND